MNAASAICYASHADKRARFPSETVRAILAGARRAARERADLLTGWLDANGVLILPRHSVAQLAALHAAARAGRYVAPQPLHCDVAQDVAETIARGGDCDQWAMVILACARLLDMPAWLVAAGDTADPYRHVWCQVRAGGRWWDVDPKGTPEGLEFGQRATFDVAHSWPL